MKDAYRASVANKTSIVNRVVAQDLIYLRLYQAPAHEEGTAVSLAKSRERTSNGTDGVHVATRARKIN